MELNTLNLTAFEKEFFGKHDNRLRYGQALQLVFGTSIIDGVDYFYEENTKIVQDAVWNQVSNQEN